MFFLMHNDISIKPPEKNFCYPNCTIYMFLLKIVTIQNLIFPQVKDLK